MAFARLLGALALAAACGEVQHADAPVGPPVVAVIDPGAAPRHRLRYALELGTTERVTVDLKLRSRFTYTNTVLENGEMDADLPTLHVSSRFDLLSVDRGGAQVASEVEDARVLEDVIDPRLRDSAEREVAKLRGARETWHVTPTGHVSDRTGGRPFAQQDPVPTASSLISAGLVGGPVEFPDAELGVGAIWRVTSHSVVGKAKFADELTYRIVAIDGDTVSLRIELASTARDQAMSVEPNASTRLTSGHVKAEIDATVALHELVAVGAQHTFADLSFLLVRQHLRIQSTMTFDASFGVQHVAAASGAPGDIPPR